MTNEQLQAIKKLSDAATPGPWICGSLAIRGVEGKFVADILLSDEADAAFIAAAREAVPALLAEVERLKAELDSVYAAAELIDAFRDSKTGWPVGAIQDIAAARAPRETCPECGGTGEVDSGGFSPWGSSIDMTCTSCNGRGWIVRDGNDDNDALVADSPSEANLRRMQAYIARNTAGASDKLPTSGFFTSGRWDFAE